MRGGKSKEKNEEESLFNIIINYVIFITNCVF